MPLIKMLRSHKSTDGPPVQAHIVKSNIFKVSQIKFVMLTLFSMGGGGGDGGDGAKKTHTSFSLILLQIMELAPTTF